MNPNDLSHQYNPLADTFESVQEEGNRVSRGAFRKMLPEIKGKDVLDIACGEGTDCAFYLEGGAKSVAGIDASKELIEKGKKKYPGIDFQEGLFEKIPFRDEVFDFVFSKYALMTSADLEPIFNEVHRVLKSGGEFVFLVTHPIRQFYEKKKEGKDYFKKEIVESVCFDGALTFREPTHTLQEYFSPFMLNNFTLLAYDEQFDPAAEKIVDVYPSFMTLRWVKK